MVVLALRYYACDRCDAVHADVDAPTACGRCGRRGTDAFTEVTDALQDASYFEPPARD
jgi:rubrerythrin